MDPNVAALVGFLHLLGAVLAVGGLYYLGFVVAPAARTLDRERNAFGEVLRRRGGALAGVTIVVLLVTGLWQWMPFTGGVGWLGRRGPYTGALHAKIALALVVFHLATTLARMPVDAEGAAKRVRRARLAAVLGIVIIALAVFHKRVVLPA